MSKYTEEFRRNAIELMKKVGITQAAKELKVAHCTIYRWCRELEGMTPGEPEEIGSTDVDKLIEDQEKENIHLNPVIRNRWMHRMKLWKMKSLIRLQWQWRCS